MAEYFNFQDISEILNIITSQFGLHGGSFEKHFKNFCNISQKLHKKIFEKLKDENIKISQSKKNLLTQQERIELILKGLEPDDELVKLLSTVNFFHINIPYFKNECFLEIELNIFFHNTIVLNDLFCESASDPTKNPILLYQNLLEKRHIIVHRENYNLEYDLDQWLNSEIIESEREQIKSSMGF